MSDFWPRFVLASLAVWRISHLLALEDGPFDLVVRLRIRLGDAGRLLDCFYCLSLWVAAPMALFVSPTGQDWWCIWPALSGSASLLHRFSERFAVQDTRGQHDGMLWTEAGPTGEASGASTSAHAGLADYPRGGIGRNQP